jgi:ATP-dependent exoDNAse (exonuclease V) beta subunit
VVLADVTCNETMAEPSRTIDPARGLCALRLAGCIPPDLREQRTAELERERGEAARVLYVAATRARDLLVVPVIGDERYAGWLEALDPALYPNEARRRQPETSKPTGCPAFGSDSVVERPARAPGCERSVAPGEHRPEAGDHRVVWWDPRVLKLGVEESVGLRQQRLLEADENGTRSEQGIARHAAWQQARAEVRATAAAPSVRVVTATEWSTGAAPTPTGTEPSAPARLGAETMAAVRVEDVGVSADRPRGKRFGTLVHAVLAVVDLDAEPAQVERVAALQARLLGAPDVERAAAAEAALAALAHPLLRRAAVAGRAGLCRRETPVALCLDDGTLVEGVVDVAFRDQAKAEWTVVDFKTDVEIAERLVEYRAQVALYARAIARATGGAAEPVLLRV